MSQVPGADRIAEVEGGGADQQIRKRNRATELPGIRVNLRGKLGHLPGERFYRDRRENGIEVLAPLQGLLRGLSAMQAVFQFDHGNGREHDFGLAVLTFECRQQFAYRSGVTLGGDQHPGVED